MPAEQLEFKAELKELLRLITHSLYSDREIFLRELISNASDAINKVKFDSLQNEEKLEGNKDWKIKITPDETAGTLTISDNGVGMSREQVVDLLGTVAKSGTKAFLAAAKGKPEQPGLIGQFGVGFYSAFMVADKVTVVTRPAGSPSDGVKWESDGQGTFAVEPAEKANRGTDVILHLKNDAKDFLKTYRLSGLVRKFSDFIEHPVVMDEETEKDGTKTVTEEVLNNRKAIWLRQPREVTDEEYAEFYKTVSHDMEAPLKALHFAIEGNNEFKALVFLPAKKPFSFDWEEPKAGLKLYVQRVLIMDRCEELLPLYLRFVKGVVDAADLPLNVSREILQQTKQLANIKKMVVKNVLDGLAGVRNTKPDEYARFFADFGPVLKEGIGRDFENREKIADLCLFASANTEAGKTTTLNEYVGKMPEGQGSIYFLVGESAEQLRNSPYLEAFKAKGFDVLLCTDPIDEFALSGLGEFKGKKLEQADRAETKPDTGEVPDDVKVAFEPLLGAIKHLLTDVSDVRLTTRLTSSAAVLVADAGAMTAHMQRLMQRWGEDASGPKRVLELNPNNPAVQAVKVVYEKNAADPRVEVYARLLLDQAVVAEGSKVTDPAAFARRVSELITADASR
ncbi:MAG: molecular chaperone HtpG [Fimbriiglobus sp.]|nr:molecular chaperone HtpG [Fimbriiglobus sp.]